MWKSLALAGSLLAALASPARAEPPRVVASIQPLHSLVAGVMAGVAEPDVLVSGPQSEHTYALKPSDIRLLSDASVVVLVNEKFEGFLAKPIKRLAADATVIRMADLAGLQRRSLREGGAWDEDGHDHKGHDHGHDDEDVDFHLWLDPANAKILVAELAERLSNRDSANAARYRANAVTLAQRLDELDAGLKAKLAPVAGRPYVVFHDAYQYFEARYGLSPAGSVTVDPERPSSAKRLAALRDRLKAAGASCVFREPQFDVPVVQTLATSAGARVGVLDPQGADIPPGPDQYFILMERLADSLVQCLSAR